MINQISPIQTKTQALAQFNKGLIQARHIQARLKEASHHSSEGSFRGSIAAPANLLPVNSWFD